MTSKEGYGNYSKLLNERGHLLGNAMHKISDTLFPKILKTWFGILVDGDYEFCSHTIIIVNVVL